MGLADKILGRFSKTKTPGTGDEPDGDESASPSDTGSDDGGKGKILKAALAKGDDAAICEAVRNICA
jgi:hypothetical protein